ncbi:RING finger protein nhl-1-like [Watersipora subatra]|uniref:RING finger protein nhl-1-like n=1 Tax=Watersipora subatra TaxID=2589382 RepID=UPI00355C447D
MCRPLGNGLPLAGELPARKCGEMASSENINDSLNQMITCPICYEQTSQLKSLPCQHTICLLCITQLPVRQHKSHCPTCNKIFLEPNGGFDQLPDCLLAKQIAALVQQNSSVGTSSDETQDESNKEEVEEKIEAERSENLRKKKEKASKESKTQLIKNLEEALNRGKQWQAKATEQEKLLKERQEGIPETNKSAKEAIIKYRDEVKLKCEKKLEELTKREADEIRTIDSQLNTLKSLSDNIVAANEFTPELLSKLSDESCSDECIAQAREQLERLATSTDALMTCNFEAPKREKSLERGDCVRITFNKDESVQDFIDSKVSLSSIGIVTGYGNLQGKVVQYSCISIYLLGSSSTAHLPSDEQ